MTQQLPRFLMLISFIWICNLGVSFSQNTIWSDNFDAPSGGASNNNAGAGWTLNSEGNTSNRWFINTPSSIGCTSSGNVLHISCTGLICGFLGGPNEPIYAASGNNLKTASSPNISTLGQTNLTLNFDFICEGFAGSDFGTLSLSSDGGSNWTDLPGTYSGVSTCSTKTITIPTQYENIANFRMRFKWQEANASNGVDPPFSIDNIRITTPTAGCIPPTVSAGSATGICIGQTANLGGAPTASGGSGNGTYTYAWTPSAGLNDATIANPIASPIATTTYNLIVTQGGAVCTGTGSVTVTVNSTITPTFATINPICAGTAAPTLPTTSTNGISGTWLPSTISNTTTGNYTFTPSSNPCATPVTITVTVNSTITPTFATINPICAGTTAPTLPTTSTNGISGTWNPSTISNTTTGNYTFTPSSNPCATTVTITVTVNSTITPTFATINPICAGTTAPTLPTTSTNGISGTWSPSTISNTTTGNYTFTPSSNPCATPVTITVTVNSSIPPTFATINPICAGTTAPTLPTTSTNGISGTWSPSAINNTTTGNYTFTPSSNPCATPVTITVTVNSSITPTFATIDPICAGTSAPTLLTTSTNGISGTWSPSTISNTTTGNYTFTPSSNPCATPVTITVTVNSSITPTFATINPICAGTIAPTLPTTSTNGISGTWNPAVVSNTTTGNYTFTPSSNPCATPVTITVTVNSNITPTFATINPICAGTTAPTLPTTSTNGISGTWSPSSISNTATGNYTFTPSSNPCATPVTITVTVNSTITPTFATINPICAGTTAPTLPTTSTNGISGTWNPSVVSNSTTGNYTFTPSSNPCATPVTITVTVNSTITPTFATINPICAGTAAPTLPTTSTNGISGTWNPSVINNATTGNYTFTPSSNPCATPVTITVIVNQPALITISPNGNLTVCEGVQTSFDAESGFTNYIWSFPEGTLNGQSINSTSQGNFSVSATDANGCISNSTLTTISFYPEENLLVLADGPLTICQGDNVVLTGQNGFSNYLWSNNVSGQSLTVTQSGIYSLSGTSGNGCIITSADFTIVSISNFSVSISPQGPIESCEGVVVQLVAQPGFSNYSWSNSISNDTLIVLESGGYSVSAEDENGCVGVSGIVDVVIQSAPVANFTYAQTFTTEYEVQFTNNTPGDNNYLWNFGGNNTSTEENPTFVFAFDNSWPVELIVSNTCGSDTISINVSVIKTGLSDIKTNQSFQISPNPGQDLIHISNKANNEKIKTIKLVDLTGKVVFKEEVAFNEKTEIILNTKEIAAGLYYILIETQTEVISRKWMKQ